MISIQTFIIPSQQSLSELYTSVGDKELQKHFVTPEQFVQLCTVEPDKFRLKIDEMNIAIVIHINDEKRIGFEQWGLDLWGSYLSALNGYIESGLIYGEAMYGIDAKLIGFKKTDESLLELILKYDPLHVDKTITRFSWNEREFLQHLVNAADEFYSFMQDHNFSIHAHSMNLLFKIVELLR